MRTWIVADVSSNHLGDIEVAKAMIAEAARAGVDCVKFQSWRAESLRRDFPDYAATYARHRRAELSDDDHRVLMECCRAHGVEFLTTCFDLGRVEFLASLGLKRVKVASPDCGSVSLLKALRRRIPSLIVSTGMATEAEVLAAVEATRGHDVVFLHCVSLYPTPPGSVNLRRMEWLRSLGVRVGFSDHTLGADAGRAAIARGAEVLEKHFTLSRALPGKDQAMSAEAAELAELARFARAVAEMDGTDRPALSAEELRLREIYVGKWGDNR